MAALASLDARFECCLQHLRFLCRFSHLCFSTMLSIKDWELPCVKFSELGSQHKHDEMEAFCEEVPAVCQPVVCRHSQERRPPEQPLRPSYVPNISGNMQRMNARMASAGMLWSRGRQDLLRNDYERCYQWASNEVLMPKNHPDGRGSERKKKK